MSGQETWSIQLIGSCMSSLSGFVCWGSAGLKACITWFRNDQQCPGEFTGDN